MESISRKQFLLTGYLEVLLKLFFSRTRINHPHSSDFENSNIVNYSDDLPSIEIITPSDPKQRGSQLSISFSVPLCAVQEELKKNGIVVRIPCLLSLSVLFASIMIHVINDLCDDCDMNAGKNQSHDE